LGKLTNDTQLHDSLTNTIQTATKLLEDIRENPERYLSIRVRLF
jgi:phospholipid/cholesterol/gamma-HCH transport system substrate-binding protein